VGGRNLLLSLAAGAGLAWSVYLGNGLLYRKELLQEVQRKMPAVMQNLEEDFAIDFEGEKPKEGAMFFPFPLLLGMYSFQDNAIEIDAPAFAWKDQSEREEKLESTLRHETGHFYHDLRSEKLGRKSDTCAYESEYTTRFCNLLSEGISGYLQKVTEAEVNKKFLNHREGYYLIKPLMDEFGVQPVVDYIVTHPPEVIGNLRDDVLNYQREIQDALRERK